MQTWVLTNLRGVAPNWFPSLFWIPLCS
jgi:hypothetical protein